MSVDTELQKHYAFLSGIDSPREVETVELKLGERRNSRARFLGGRERETARACPVWCHFHT